MPQTIDSGPVLVFAVHMFIQFSFLIILFIGIGIGSRNLDRADSCNRYAQSIMEKNGIVYVDEKTKRKQDLLSKKSKLKIQKENYHG